MPKITSLAPPTLDDGQNANEDFFCEEEVLNFNYTRRDGKAVKCAMIVDATRITQVAMRKYLKGMAEISREAKSRESELSQSEASQSEASQSEASQSEASQSEATAAEAIQGEPIDGEMLEIETAEGEYAVVSADEIEFVEDDEEEAFSADSLELIAEYTDLMARLATVEAEFLAPAIAHDMEGETPRRGWNVPHLEPTAEVLSDTAGIGQAARLALKEWYFPTSSAQAEVIGNSATANTPAV